MTESHVWFLLLQWSSYWRLGQSENLQKQCFNSPAFLHSKPPHRPPPERNASMTHMRNGTWLCIMILCVSLRKCSNLLLPCRVLLNFAQWLGWSLLKASHCQPLGVRELLWQSTHRKQGHKTTCTMRWNDPLILHSVYSSLDLQNEPKWTPKRTPCLHRCHLKCQLRYEASLRYTQCCLVPGPVPNAASTEKAGVFWCLRNHALTMIIYDNIYIYVNMTVLGKF